MDITDYSINVTNNAADCFANKFLRELPHTEYKRIKIKSK